MKFMIRLLALALALLVSACGVYSPLKQYDKQTFTGLEIGEIRINRQIGIGSWFEGAVAAAQGSNLESLGTGIVEKDSINYSPDQDLARLRSAMNQSGLDLQASINTAFAQELKNRKSLQVRTQASHRIVLSVDAFLLGYKPLSGYGPDFGIQAELFDASGRSGWKNYRYVTHFNGQLPHHSIDDFVKNPAELRKAYEMAIALVIKDLLADLETEVNDRATEYIDNITGDRVRIEPLKPVKPAAVLPMVPAAPQAQPAAVAPAPGKEAKTGETPAPVKKEAAPKEDGKPVAKKMRLNPITNEMEEETNCNGFCGLQGGFKFDNKNLTD